jgi:nitrogen regulatory protein PII
MLVVIADRDDSEAYVQLYSAQKILLTVAALGIGTASREVLDTFSLDDSEKAVLISVATQEKIHAVIKNMQRHILIENPGTGIVFTIPLSSIGGEASAQCLASGDTIERKELLMNTEDAHELIIAITNEGYSSLVMDAAKHTGGARGGTILHARGARLDDAQKFFGISIADEKELVLIACRADIRNNIMQAISEEAGFKTKAKSIVFSVPISSVAGFWTLKEEND